MSKATQYDKKALVPRKRFPKFRETEAWVVELGSEIFDQVSNKNHNADLPVLAITQEHGAIPRNLINYHVSVSEKSLQSYKVVEVGDFIISLRSFQGGIEFSNYKGICSPAYVVLRLKRGYAQDFFRHYLKSDQLIRELTKNLEGLRDGKMISYKQFSKANFVIPPLVEQQRIANCLSSIDALITAQEEKIDALKTHKQGLLQQLFPREGETMPRLRFSEFQEAEEWVASQLEEHTSKIGSGVTPRGGSSNYKTEGRPFVRSQNVGWGELILDDIVYVDEETHSSFSSTEIMNNDVLLNISGASIGRSSIANRLITGGNVNQHVCIIRTKMGTLNPAFLNQFLLSQEGQKQIDSFQAGGNRQGLNFGQIRSFSIPFPPKIEEQQKVAACLSSLDTLIIAQSEKLDALKTHKSGLTQQLFSSPETVVV